MRLIRLSNYFTELLKQRFRTIKAIIKYPHIQIGTGVIIRPNCIFGKEIKIDQNTVIAEATIGDFTYIGSNNEIKYCTIGRYCSIASNIKISLGIHPTDKISTYPGFYSNDTAGTVKFTSDPSIIEHKPVNIGHDVWIGANSLIMDGVTIGNGAVIGAGSVVTKDVIPYAIVAGVPAKLIKMRFDTDQIALLEQFKWWDKGLAFCQKNGSLFLNPNEFFKRIKEGELND